MTAFGCDYCRDDQNRLYGHVTQIGSDEPRRMILLRCPLCSALYENSPDGPDRTRRLSEAEAAALFPGFRGRAQRRCRFDRPTVRLAWSLPAAETVAARSRSGVRVTRRPQRRAVAGSCAQAGLLRMP